MVLRISEGKDLGDIDRFAFYEATKTLIASPPDTLRCNPKFVRPYYVLNVVGMIITTNHKVGGLFLTRRRPPPLCRVVAGRTKRLQPRISGRNTGRSSAPVARTRSPIILRALDLARFSPKAPPPRTQAFWEMVNAMRSEKESEMDDVIENLGTPKALVIADLIASADLLGSRYDAFVAFLKDRTKSRLVTIRLEGCGYRRLTNPDEAAGRWVVGGQRTGVYVRQEMSDREGFEAVKALKG